MKNFLFWDFFFQNAGNVKKSILCENDENSPQKQSLPGTCLHNQYIDLCNGK
jgi:hypothetical protein